MVVEWPEDSIGLRGSKYDRQNVDMLNKSIFFSKVPKYLYHKDKTPYFTNPKEMTLVQSQYELFSYGVLIGTIFFIYRTCSFFKLQKFF